MPVNNRFLRKRQHTHHGNITFIKMLPSKFEETKVASTVLKSLNLTFRRALANVRGSSLWGVSPFPIKTRKGHAPTYICLGVYFVSGDYSGEICAVAEAFRFRACLHGGGGPQVCEITRLGLVTRLSIASLIWSTHPSCKCNQIKMRDWLNGQVGYAT